MGMRRLLIASVLCTATYGCGTTSTEPKAAAPTEPTAAATQPRREPVYTTGSRLPSTNPAAVQGVSREGWEDERRNASGQIIK
jgi:hypothetical protein